MSFGASIGRILFAVASFLSFLALFTTEAGQY